MYSSALRARPRLTASHTFAACAGVRATRLPPAWEDDEYRFDFRGHRPFLLPLNPLNLHRSLAASGRLWHICRYMDRDFVITKLREHEPELKAAGIVHLRLHGSLARGTATASSDVDLIAEFDAKKHLSLLDMVGLENRLSDLLGVPVDLSPEHTLKQPVAERAARESVRAF